MIAPDAYTLADAARREATGGVISSLRPQTAARSFHGRALTARVQYEPHGSIPLHEYGIGALLDQIREGHVLVLDAGGLALTAAGALVAEHLTHHKAAAMVINANIRDVHEIEALGLPAFAKDNSISTMAGHARIVGIGEAVNIEGIRIETGDYMAGCSGGVVAVPAADVDRVIARANAIDASDRVVLQGIRRGESVDDLWKKHKRPEKM